MHERSECMVFGIVCRFYCFSFFFCFFVFLHTYSYVLWTHGRFGVHVASRLLG